MYKDKILAQLIAKHSGVSKKALGLIADKLAKKVTAEDGIDQAITDFDNAVGIKEFADDLQREGDTRVTEAEKQWKAKNPPKKEAGKTKDPDDDEDGKKKEPDEMPPWAKGLVDKIDNLEREKAIGSNASKAETLLKDVPKTFWKGRTIPEKEEDLQAFVDGITTDYAAFKQEQIDAGLMTATPPASGGGAGAGAVGDKAVEAVIDSWAGKDKKVEDKK